jgi:signal transduction histidine kinase/CheY-like chemotaxis protein
VALTIVGIAIVAAGLTISGHGPIAVDEPMDIGRRILILQMFGMTVSISALTATALVAEQGRVQRSLRRSLAGARAARQRAMTAAAAKARFLATMSHEMRTPLNGIQGSVRGLEGEPGLSSAARARLSAIRTSSEALNCLIDDVLDFSQLDSAQLALDPSPTDVVGLVQGVAAMGRALIGAKPLDIAVVADAPAGQFHMLDARRLSQAILHLVTNAVKFSDRGEIRMTVSLSVGEGVVDTWRIAVADRGVGVPPEQLEEIFAPFHQADGSTTRRHGGAGLGLAISRELVSLMGGRMGAANRPEGGAEFWIETPALRAEAPPAIEPVETRPPRVLVVDDHVMNLEVARVYLEAYGCEIVCCEDGAAAVNAVAHDTFDMVFMDIHMPVMDGLEATRAIRMLASPHADTPIVALTAAATAADVSACLQAGMNAHLSKPIRGERLAEALMRFGRWDGDIASAA